MQPVPVQPPQACVHSRSTFFAVQHQRCDTQAVVTTALVAQGVDPDVDSILLGADHAGHRPFLDLETGCDACSAYEGISGEVRRSFTHQAVSVCTRTDSVPA